MEDNTFDLNDLPEEVVNEILESEVIEVAPLEEEVLEQPVKQSDNEIIDELVVAAEKKASKKAIKKAPGMYHNGRLIEAVPSRLGSKWVVTIDGKREKVLKSEIEIIE